MLLLRCLLQIIDLHRDTVPDWLLASNSINVTKFIHQFREGRGLFKSIGFWRMTLSDGVHSFEAWSLDYWFNTMIEEIKVYLMTDVCRVCT
jgi:hypothetical protein